MNESILFRNLIRKSDANVTAGLEIVKEHTIDAALGAHGNASRAAKITYPMASPEPVSVKRSLGLSPTTEMAKTKGVGVSEKHYNRSSLDYGDRLLRLPQLNDRNYHRNNNMKNFSYNILTGSYIRY